MKENSLVIELQHFAVFMEGRQKKFYDQMIKDAKPIEVVRLSEVFTPEQIDFIKKAVRPKAKECYRNAHLLTSIFPEALYVEGKMTCCKCFGILQNHYNPNKDIEKAIKLHNPRAEQSYRIKIMNQIENIKTNLS